MSDLFFGNSAALIFNRHADFFLPGLCGQADGSLFRAVFDGIGDQVNQNFFDFFPIGIDQQLRFGFYFQGDKAISIGC